MENLYLSNRWRIGTFAMAYEKIQKLSSGDPTEVVFFLRLLVVQIKPRFYAFLWKLHREIESFVFK